jgi:hypothetical protein
MFSKLLTNIATRNVASKTTRFISNSTTSTTTTLFKTQTPPIRFSSQRQFSVTPFHTRCSTHTPKFSSIQKPRHFSTTPPTDAAKNVAAEATPAVEKAVVDAAASTEANAATTTTTTTTAAEGATVTPAPAAYSNIKGFDPALLEEKKAVIRKRMWYYRVFAISWAIVYVITAKNWHGETMKEFENLPKLEERLTKNKTWHLYTDASRDKWSTPTQAVYTGKNDLNDQKNVQKLLLRHVMMAQYIASLLLQSKAELLKLRQQVGSAKYRHRFGEKDVIILPMSGVSDVQEKLANNGVTTLMAFDHDMEEDQGFLAMFNPMRIVASKKIPLALQDCYQYPILGKLALKRSNAFILWFNSMMNDEWYAQYGDQFGKFEEFEQLYEYWEQENGYKRYQPQQNQRYTNGGYNIIPNCTTDFIKSEIDNVVAQTVSHGSVTLNALTITPQERLLLELPSPDDVIDVSKLPPKSIWSKVDVVYGEMLKSKVPRSGYYYTPSPPLPVVNVQTGIKNVVNNVSVAPKDAKYGQVGQL